MNTEMVSLDVGMYNQLVAASLILKEEHDHHRRLYVRSMREHNKRMGIKFWKRVRDSNVYSFKYDAFSDPLSLGIDVKICRAVDEVEWFAEVPEVIQATNIAVPIYRVNLLVLYQQLVNDFSLSKWDSHANV